MSAIRDIANSRSTKSTQAIQHLPELSSVGCGPFGEDKCLHHRNRPDLSGYPGWTRSRLPGKHLRHLHREPQLQRARNYFCGTTAIFFTLIALWEPNASDTTSRPDISRALKECSLKISNTKDSNAIPDRKRISPTISSGRVFSSR
jgi:hypothetical protein